MTTAAILCLSLIAAAQRDPGVALLERDGWSLIAAGRAGAAAEAFRQALASDPANARLHLGAATAAFLQQRDDEARAEAERALQLEPRLAAARSLLGRVQHRAGDLVGAIHTYELLSASVPDDAEAAATLGRWRRELDLHDRMQQTADALFTVSFEGPAEEAVAAAALDSLNRAYWRVGVVLGVYPANPVPVVLYTAEQFTDITRSPPWAAGAFDGTIRVPMRGALENRRELDRVLAHEFTHALIRTLAPRGVPVWLNEGLATALETGEPTQVERQIATARRVVPLERLRGSFSRLGGTEAQLAYGTSAYATRRLLESAGGVAVANLLRDLGEGADFDTAFLHRIQRTFTDFEASLY